MGYQVGETTEVTINITAEGVNTFADLSGDYNPIHINEKNEFFGRPIAHGFLVGGVLSNAIGMKLPGPGTLYMEQDMKFLRPVFLGDRVTGIIRIAKVLNEKKNILMLETTVINQNGEKVIDGFAVVKAPGRKEE